MEARHLLLMIIDACGKKIESKTKLHKIAYFISIFLEKDFRFSAYFYGPYSSQIEEGLGELSGAGFLDVNIFSYGVDSNRGFERKRYEYQMAESGEVLVEHLKKRYPAEYTLIIDRCRFLKDKSYLELSIAAKSYFILGEEEHPMTNEQIRAKANQFKWRISPYEIESAIEILKNLKLIDNTETQSINK